MPVLSTITRQGRADRDTVHVSPSKMTFFVPFKASAEQSEQCGGVVLFPLVSRWRFRVERFDALVPFGDISRPGACAVGCMEIRPATRRHWHRQHGQKNGSHRTPPHRLSEGTHRSSPSTRASA